jgi:pimeloyl-ACP methyl ester carboxylesterase
MSPPLQLVLLHPYPTDAAFWDPMRSHLRPDRRILALNAPGFGDREPQGGWTIDEAADQVALDIRTQTPGASAVMGLSMGGYIALSLAVRHPEQCARLILADTRADADDDAGRAARYAAISAIRAGGQDEYLEGLLLHLVASNAEPRVSDALVRSAARQSPDGLIGALEALATRPDRRGDLRHLGMPTLVLVGDQDQVTPPSAARALAEGIPGARLIEVSGAGHLSALEHPEIVAREVEAFLSHAPPRS